MREWRRWAAEGRLEVGTRFRFSRTFTSDDVEAFGQLTRDDNPVHSEALWYEAKGFREPLCHGLLVGSMLCDPGGQVGWLATGMSFRFLKPTYVGDTVTCEMTIVEVDEKGFARAEAVLSTQRGDVVVTGELTGFVPVDGERELLRDLIEE